jgi:hypothetical protein
MGLYCGVDLHSNNSYLAVLNEQLQPLLSLRVPNRLAPVPGGRSRQGVIDLELSTRNLPINDLLSEKKRVLDSLLAGLVGCRP